MVRILTILFLEVGLVTSSLAPAVAQKKEAAKKESAPSTQSAIKEVLSQYVGKVTSMGTLKRVSGDYFVVDEDGTISMHPLSTLHTLKFVKDEESGETKLEIRLVARD